ncbi:hypothetical protein LCGC14_1493100, partial [marine sediment metagenome]
MSRRGFSFLVVIGFLVIAATIIFPECKPNKSFRATRCRDLCSPSSVKSMSRKGACECYPPSR